MSRLSGKTALVTGASRGIGRASALCSKLRVGTTHRSIAVIVYPRVSRCRGGEWILNRRRVLFRVAASLLRERQAMWSSGMILPFTAIWRR